MTTATKRQQTLGLTAYIFTSGFDGVVYAIGYTTGLPIVVFLLAGKLRKLGRHTFTDVVCTKLKERPTQIFSACASLIIVTFYLVAQMVGAGQLIQLLFGIDYMYAIVLVGVLMVLYVMFGGMVATTWVQVIKAASSVLWATVFMNSFYSMLFIIGFGALALLRSAPEYFGCRFIIGRLKHGRGPSELVK